MDTHRATAGWPDALPSTRVLFWRFVGIMTAIGVAIGLAGMVLAVVAGAIGALAAR